MGLLDGTYGSETQEEYYNENNYGSYQFTSLTDIISQFMVAYVGEDKIISKIKRADVVFHARRAMQELSFDTFKSCKSEEITVPASLQMILPQDYVNYTKISTVDSAGIKHRLYPTLSNTSNPKKYQIDSNDEFLFDSNENKILSGNLLQNSGFHAGSSPWRLNENERGDSEANGGTNTQNIITTTNAIGIEEPSQGWFYGFDGNAVRAYDILQFQSFRQENIPIIPGEKYTITYTISSYSSGSFQVFIANELGGITAGTTRTADGTYEETLTASTTGNVNTTYLPNQLWIRNSIATAGNAVIDNISIVRVGDENPNTTWENYKSATPSENQDDYQDDTYWPANGERYGLDPQHAQANGSFYIDCNSGKIHFSSNVSGQTVVLDYISDSIGTDGEMRVHKFAEEAMYKWIAHAILNGRANTPEYQVARFKKERFAAVRTAKLRLSNIKLEEITQILRGKSKHIKH